MRRPEYIDLDPIFEDAVEFAILNQSITSDDLRTKFGLGITRAEIVLGQLEDAEIIEKADEQGRHKSSFSSVEDLESMIGGPLRNEETMDYEEEDWDDYTEETDTEVTEKTTKSSDTQYSDSVNTMNGCLGAVGQVFVYTMVILLLLCTAPAIIIILLFWWIIAWILGLMFPGKEFFPIKKIWDSASRWAKEKLIVDLGSAAVAAGIIMLLTAIFGVGSSKKD